MISTIIQMHMKSSLWFLKHGYLTGYLSAIVATRSTTSLGPMKLVQAVSLQDFINLNLK